MALTASPSSRRRARAQQHNTAQTLAAGGTPHCARCAGTGREESLTRPRLNGQQVEMLGRALPAATERSTGARGVKHKTATPRSVCRTLATATVCLLRHCTVMRHARASAGKQGTSSIGGGRVVALHPSPLPSRRLPLAAFKSSRERGRGTNSWES